MDRGIPSSANEDIELYMRTYYSLLRSSGEIQIKSLIETHTQMDSSLHLNARAEFPDIAAFVYATLRLPDCIKQVRHVLLGQSDEVFDKAGCPDVENWQEVSAAGRRRKMFFDGNETLAAFIASASDIDDLIPILTAYEIEWNKMHDLMAQQAASTQCAWTSSRSMPRRDDVGDACFASVCPIWRTLENIWGEPVGRQLANHRRRTRKQFRAALAGGLAPGLSQGDAALVEQHRAGCDALGRRTARSILSRATCTVLPT